MARHVNATSDTMRPQTEQHRHAPNVHLAQQPLPPAQHLLVIAK